MKLLVIVLCLLSERYLIHSLSYQRFSWFNKYVEIIKSQIDSMEIFANPWMLLAALILPLILSTGLVYLLLQNQLFGFLGLLLSLVIFFYCLGPQNIFYPMRIEEGDDEQLQIKQYFAKVNTQLFSLLFWYVVAGPIIALTYRVITLCQEIEPVALQAKQIKEVLEWLPARITAILYLLVGNFQEGFSFLLKYLAAKPEANDELLGQCGLNAAQTNESTKVTLIQAENLVEHAAILYLVFIALFTIGALM